MVESMGFWVSHYEGDDSDGVVDANRLGIAASRITHSPHQRPSSTISAQYKIVATHATTKNIM